jgi:hypothetical protein
MISPRSFSARRAARLVCATLIAIALSAPPASSQGVFETLLGIFQPPAPRELPPQVTSYAPPIALPDPLSESRSVRDVSGPYVAYCVRLCDGYFFPLARSFAISPADQCRSFCPAAKTRVFGGNSINQAAAADGGRYANLDTALLYRKRLVDNCTCNGRDAFGLARLNIASDPTLRAGDIVAINGGFSAYTGSRSAANRNSGFIPVAQYSGVSHETRRKLSDTKVLPVRQTAAQTPTSVSDEKSASRIDRRAQLLR